jgi:hypothetical protein
MFHRWVLGQFRETFVCSAGAMSTSSRTAINRGATEVLAELLWGAHQYVNHQVSHRLETVQRLDTALRSTAEEDITESAAGTLFSRITDEFKDIGDLQIFRFRIERRVRKLYGEVQSTSINAEKCSAACQIVVSAVNVINQQVSVLFARIEALEALKSSLKGGRGLREPTTFWKAQLHETIVQSEHAIGDLEKARALLNADARMLIAQVQAACEQCLDLQRAELLEHRLNLNELNGILMRSSPHGA